MEKSAPEPIVVLKVNVNCCKACPRKLKKLLLKVPGVSSVDVHPEETLVSVTGKVDPQILIKTVKNMKKKAELVSIKEPEKERAKEKEKEKEEQNTETRKKESVQQTIHKDCCCHDSRSDSDHKFEDYISPVKKIDEEICRDPYCRIHQRKGIIHERGLPSDRHAMFWNYRPGYFPEANPPHPHWFQEQQVPYEYYQPSMPRASYGVYPGPPMPGFGNFSSYY